MDRYYKFFVQAHQVIFEIAFKVSLSFFTWFFLFQTLSMYRRDQLREYAQLQKTLVYQDLLDTCKMFAQHFTQDRLSYGLYGLYPKCRMYIDVFALLLEMAGHALIVSMLNTHQGILGKFLYFYSVCNFDK